jgi:hypothetical protein
LCPWPELLLPAEPLPELPPAAVPPPLEPCELLDDEADDWPAEEPAATEEMVCPGPSVLAPLLPPGATRDEPGEPETGITSAGSVGCRPPLRRLGLTAGFGLGFVDGRTAGDGERGGTAVGCVTTGAGAAAGEEAWTGEDATGAAVAGTAVAEP